MLIDVRVLPLRARVRVLWLSVSGCCTRVELTTALTAAAVNALSGHRTGFFI